MKIKNTEIKLEVVKGSVTKQSVDAIVNAANEKMRGGTGIDGAIHQMAGGKLLQELKQKAPNGTPTGKSVITSSYELQNHENGNKKVRYIIHTVGPRWEGGGIGKAEKLASAYRSCLEIVDQHNQNIETHSKVTSIAFCSISTGIFHYPLAQAAPIALKTVVEYLHAHPDTALRHVIFAMYGKGWGQPNEEYDAFTMALADLDQDSMGQNQNMHSGVTMQPKQNDQAFSDYLQPDAVDSVYMKPKQAAQKPSAPDVSQKPDLALAIQQQDIDVKLHKLLTDPRFLDLARSRNRPNLFHTLAASHMEMWHSAFVRWLIDPESHLGLGDYPLKRFLFAIVNFGKSIGKHLELSIAEIEDMDFQGMKFDTEYTDPELLNAIGKKARIDIFGVSKKVKLHSSPDITTSIRILIENKIKAQEAEDQTAIYYNFVKKSAADYQNDFLVFLTPDDSQQPKCASFVQMIYQDLCDFVIKPCLDHPALPEESRYLLEQYLLNLGRPLKGGRVMALPNKEICQKIYESHKEVLDEIFVSVKGEAPGHKQHDKATSSANVTLDQLVNRGILNLTDTLYLKYRGQEYSAHLDKKDGTVKIFCEGMKQDGTKHDPEGYTRPSRASIAVKGTSDNGWTSWIVKDATGKPKGSLKSLQGQMNPPSDDPDNSEQDEDSTDTTDIS